MAEMKFDTGNPVVQCCSKAMMLEGVGKFEEASLLFQQAWETASDYLEKCIAAHYIARSKPSAAEKLEWDRIALTCAQRMETAGTPEALYPSLYLNVAKCYEDLGDLRSAFKNYTKAASWMNCLANDGYGNMIRSGIKDGLKRTMVINDYQKKVELQQVTTDQVFKALTCYISEWWTRMFDGASEAAGDVFNVRFGARVFKTIKIAEIIPRRKIVWQVIDSMIAMPGLNNQAEWVGTTIVWEMITGEDGVVLELTHIGLNSGKECFDICKEGWLQFTGSLKLYIETGIGNPYTEA